MKNTENLEMALEKVDLVDEIHNDIINTVWEFINKKDREAFLTFMKNVKFPALTKILKKFIQTTGATNIITTNYDKIIEYSIDFASGNIETGFSGNYIKNFDNFKTATNKRTVNLFKVHGSIDWFKHKSNQNIFSTNFHNIDELSNLYLPVIVTPGNGKYKETHKEPFRSVIGEADKALRNSTSYLCIGYGFNDEHIQPIIIDENKNKNKALIIVTKVITQKMNDLFLNDKTNNCLILAEKSGGGTVVYYNKSEKEEFEENYWYLDDFYKLWFE